MAAIDVMVRGEDPRQYRKRDYGFPAETASDLIGEILSNLGEDGNFIPTTASKPIPVGASITNTYSLLALEMYYAGGDWQLPGGMNGRRGPAPLRPTWKALAMPNTKTQKALWGDPQWTHDRPNGIGYAHGVSILCTNRCGVAPGPLA